MKIKEIEIKNVGICLWELFIDKKRIGALWKDLESERYYATVLHIDFTIGRVSSFELVKEVIQSNFKDMVSGFIIQHMEEKMEK